MHGTHFSVVLSEDEIAAIADAAVEDLATRLAHRAFRPLAAYAHDPESLAESDTLAHLHALVHLQRAVERQADRAAQQAAPAQHGYPQLGRACNISRQGARRRWPGLVPSAKSTHATQPSHESQQPQLPQASPASQEAPAPRMSTASPGSATDGGSR